MWKNVFIESCILSALIFGGFYIHATVLKKEINETQDKSSQVKTWVHISGFKVPTEKRENPPHLSGNETKTEPVSPISGADQQSLTHRQ